MWNENLNEKLSRIVELFINIDSNEKKNDGLGIPPHQINPFLRTLETMGLRCKVHLDYKDNKPIYVVYKA